MPITVFSMLFALAVHSFLTSHKQDCTSNPLLALLPSLPNTHWLPTTNHSFFISPLSLTFLNQLVFLTYFFPEPPLLHYILSFTFVKLHFGFIMQYRSRNKYIIWCFYYLYLNLFFIVYIRRYLGTGWGLYLILSPFSDTHLWVCQTHLVRTHMLTRCCRWLWL